MASVDARRVDRVQQQVGHAEHADPRQRQTDAALQFGFEVPF
jgi:hypothetical protein